jgi:hypothetical protein
MALDAKQLLQMSQQQLDELFCAHDSGPIPKGPGADSEEKHEPASDIDTAMADSLKALDPKRPIREADVGRSR